MPGTRSLIIASTCTDATTTQRTANDDVAHFLDAMTVLWSFLLIGFRLF